MTHNSVPSHTPANPLAHTLSHTHTAHTAYTLPLTRLLTLPLTHPLTHSLIHIYTPNALLSFAHLITSTPSPTTRLQTDDALIQSVSLPSLLATDILPALTHLITSTPSPTTRLQTDDALIQSVSLPSLLTTDGGIRDKKTTRSNTASSPPSKPTRIFVANGTNTSEDDLFAVSMVKHNTSKINTNTLIPNI